MTSCGSNLTELPNHTMRRMPYLDPIFQWAHSIFIMSASRLGIITFRNRRWTLLLRFAGVGADSIRFPNVRINFHIGKVGDLASSYSATYSRHSYLVVPDPMWVMWDLSGLQAPGGMRRFPFPVMDSLVPLDMDGPLPSGALRDFTGVRTRPRRPWRSARWRAWTHAVP